MQWTPGLYVYYGQYRNNLRHGYGIMKRNFEIKEFFQQEKTKSNLT